jgi:hypothetical protein
MKWQHLVILCALAWASCVRRSPAVFRVVPASPNYVLHYPDSRQAGFPEVLRVYNGFERGHAWMDLRPDMELRIENAYYKPGSSRRGLNGFLGTEIAQYKLQSHGGLHLFSVASMKNRPSNEPPVQKLIPPSQQHHRYFRFYYEVLFRRSANARGSVLLSANAKDEIDRLTTELSTDPDSLCGGGFVPLRITFVGRARACGGRIGRP